MGEWINAVPVKDKMIPDRAAIMNPSLASNR
jgi:hypothetical protein